MKRKLTGGMNLVIKPLEGKEIKVCVVTRETGTKIESLVRRIERELFRKVRKMARKTGF